MAETKTAYNRIEMLQAADVVAREKSIDREQVLEAMEMALQKAARAKYGHEHDIRATIDRRPARPSSSATARSPIRSRTSSPRSPSPRRRRSIPTPRSATS
jgi:hypothetical protein